MRQMTLYGRKIECGSFKIIDQEVGEHQFSPSQWEIVRRVIHTTADFDFKDILEIHPKAIESGIAAVKNGCSIVADVNMISAGVRKSGLLRYRCNLYSYISNADVIQEAKTKGTTRAIVSMQKAKRLDLFKGGIVAIGNAPTALIEVVRMIREESLSPALVIGVPVGFVKAKESKDELASLDIPYIISRGRKGGSAVAVAILHALFSLCADENG